MRDHLKQIKFKVWVLALWALLSVMFIIVANPSKLISKGGAAAQTQSSFVEFESGQVRPLAISPDGSRLFAVNTPDNTLEVFNITSAGLHLQPRVPVGLEPVA